MTSETIVRFVYCSPDTDIPWEKLVSCSYDIEDMLFGDKREIEFNDGASYLCLNEINMEYVRIDKYSGFKDRYGRMIFENDIDDCGNLVVFNKGSFYLSNPQYDTLLEEMVKYVVVASVQC